LNTAKIYIEVNTMNTIFWRSLRCYSSRRATLQLGICLRKRS